MPISSTAIIPYIVEEIITKQPKTVLDVGIGNGVYGALIYNYATTMMEEIPEIDGVEAWENYRGTLWDVYREVYIKDLRKFEPDDQYDVIIMADVIEHMKLTDGHKQVERYKDALTPGGMMIISTPAVFFAQGAHKGNTYETHLSLWAPNEFKKHNMTPLRPPGLSILGERMLVYKYEKPIKTQDI